MHNTNEENENLIDDGLFEVPIGNIKVDQETVKRFLREAKWQVTENCESQEAPSSKKGQRLSPKSQAKVHRIQANKIRDFRSDILRQNDIASMDKFVNLLKASRISEEIEKKKPLLSPTEIEQATDLIEIKITKKQRNSVLRDITQIIPKKKSRVYKSNDKPPTISKESTARTESKLDKPIVAPKKEGPRSISQNPVSQQQFVFDNVP